MNRRTGQYVIIWILILATIYLGDRFLRDLMLTAEEPRAVTARGTLAEAEQSAIGLFERTAPSVVYIFTRNSHGAGGGAAPAAPAVEGRGLPVVPARG